MMNYRIPLSKPFLTGNELDNITRAVESGHISGDGPYTKKCHALLEEKFRAKKAFLTVSGTAALEMAAILCDVGPGDEVIVPSFSFVSSANAFYLRRAKPVFVDIRPDTLNLDETKIEEAINGKTKVILPVHYAGISCEMDAIAGIARKHNLLVVEDAAHGVASQYNGRYLGTIGDFGACSFHETKNFICGEGGAILINNEAYLDRAEIIWEKGTDRSRFLRGEVEQYTWMDVGSSYLPSDLLAAFLYAQLENMEKITVRRAEIFEFYNSGLKRLEDSGLVRLPAAPRKCSPNNHLFYILLEDTDTRRRLIGFLKEKGIHATFHFLPLHLSPVGKSLGYREGQFPVTESISGRLLRLPLYCGLKDVELAEIVDSISSFFGRG